MTILLEIVGVPYPKGDKSAVIVRTKAGPRAKLIEGKSKEARANLGAWEDAVRDAAQAHVARTRMSPMTCPASISILFRFAPVASDPDRHFHVVPPDADKLLRSTFDALVHGGLLKGDQLLASGSWLSRYVEANEPVGAVVRIDDMSEAEARHKARRKSARLGR